MRRYSINFDCISWFRCIRFDFFVLFSVWFLFGFFRKKIFLFSKSLNSLIELIYLSILCCWITLSIRSYRNAIHFLLLVDDLFSISRVNRMVINNWSLKHRQPELNVRLLTNFLFHLAQFSSLNPLSSPITHTHSLYYHWDHFLVSLSYLNNLNRHEIETKIYKFFFSSRSILDDDVILVIFLVCLHRSSSSSLSSVIFICLRNIYLIIIDRSFRSSHTSPISIHSFVFFSPSVDYISWP